MGEETGVGFLPGELAVVFVLISLDFSLYICNNLEVLFSVCRDRRRR